MKKYISITIIEDDNGIEILVHPDDSECISNALAEAMVDYGVKLLESEEDDEDFESDVERPNGK